MAVKILRLPESVINQIAAGEVVENPASIVKELVENSLDAGAKKISVEITAGGQQLIHVEDDGCGMDPEDALLSLERHATSKIRTAEDLQALHTMGFRGEALAAISAVSQFELRTSNGIVGTRIAAEGGRIVVVEPCARNQGTTIEVRSLFYNVPARKKFQKSAAANAGQVTRVVEMLAMAHPETAFTLGKRVFEETGFRERIEEIAGVQEHEIRFEKGGLSLRGLLSAPDKAGLNRNSQYLYVNRRPIFSPLISRAIKNGYGTRIGETMHPGFVLFLEIPPGEVDVNVHPQKKEARFSDEGRLFRFFEEAVSGAFGSNPVFFDPISFTPPPAFSFAEEPLFPRFPRKEIEVPLPLSFTDRCIAVIGSYLLLEKGHWIFVDLKAAHARILYESLQEEKGHSQTLMLPLEIHLADADDEILEGLQKIGVEAHLLGRKTLCIDALPSSLEAADFPQFFENWREGKKLGISVCRFCRARKKVFSLTEAECIWRQLQACRDRVYDPMGNAIWKEVREDDVEKWVQS